MLAPKRTKYRRQFRGRTTGAAKGGDFVAFGDFGLQTLDCGWITARQIEAGEPVPSIPEEMVFVVGDVLEVKNEDSVSHQLGPIWVPPGSSGRLVMEQAEKLSLNCSFQSNQFLGLDVRPATNLNTRLIALFLTTPTLAVLIFLYSLAAYPIRSSGAKKASA